MFYGNFENESRRLCRVRDVHKARERATQSFTTSYLHVLSSTPVTSTVINVSPVSILEDKSCSVVLSTLSSNFGKKRWEDSASWLAKKRHSHGLAGGRSLRVGQTRHIFAFFVTGDLCDISPVFGDHSFAQHRVVISIVALGPFQGWP